MSLSATVTFANTTKKIILKKSDAVADVRRQVFGKFDIDDASSSHYILMHVDPITKTELALDNSILRNIQSDEICMTVSYINDGSNERQTKSNNDAKQCSHYGNFREEKQSIETCSTIQQTPLFTARRQAQLVRQYGKDMMENINGDSFRVKFPLEQYSQDEMISLFDQYLIPDSMPTPVRQMIKEKYLALLYNEHFQIELSKTITKQARVFSKEILLTVNIKSCIQNNHLICVIAYGELELPRQFFASISPSQQYESILQKFCIEASRED